MSHTTARFERDCFQAQLLAGHGLLYHQCGSCAFSCLKGEEALEPLWLVPGVWLTAGSMQRFHLFLSSTRHRLIFENLLDIADNALNEFGQKQVKQGDVCFSKSLYFSQTGQP
jgi:hypothetical protein